MSSSPTRSRQRASLVMTALSTPTCQDLRISSLEGLQNFIQLGAYNANIGRVVEDLRITLPRDSGYPAQAVRAALRLTPNLESLVLDLPPQSPITLLNGLEFPNLRVFSTSLPHRALVSFFNLNPSLSALALQDCGRSGTCPLSGIELRDLCNLQCPSRCFVGITHGPLVSATVNLSRLTSMSSLAIRSLCSSNLHSLTMDYFINDYDSLLLVVSTTPNLRKLKLNEKAQPQRRHDGGVRRPWNDLREWHRALLRLPYLEELMLRTLICICGPTRTELEIVTAWACGVGRHSVPHPSLYHIALIQRDPAQAAGVASQQQLTHWFKNAAGAWERLNTTVVGPSKSFTL
ncbi:hypothetical protein BV20DRAFT_1058363 [Pilatotrama ljubarskyi]|nr:hypothetical protein BV20DRAFT_1058363 [Pilatotrama ljubarskyi]